MSQPLIRTLALFCASFLSVLVCHVGCCGVCPDPADKVIRGLISTTTACPFPSVLFLPTHRCISYPAVPAQLQPSFAFWRASAKVPGGEFKRIVGRLRAE